MIELICIWGIVYIFFSFLLKEKKYSPVFIFNIYWLVLAIGAYVRVNDHIQTSERVYLIIFIGMMSFTVGYYLPILKFRKKKQELLLEYEINKPLFYTFVIANIIILIICSIRSIGFLIVGYSLNSIRYLLSSDILSRFEVWYKFFTVPLFFVIMTLFSWEVVSKEKNKFVLMSTLVYLTLITLTEVSMLLIFAFFVSVALAFVVSGKQITMSAKNKRRIILFLFFAFIAGVWTNNARGTEYSITEKTYNYFTCALPFFSQKLERTDIFLQKTYGVASFQGVIRPVMGVLELFGVQSPTFDEATDFLLYLQNNAERIYGNDYYNYFSTCFSSMYKDGGYIGVIMISFLWGIFERRLFHEMRVNYNRKTMCLYLMGIVSILIGCMEFFCFEPKTVWGYIFLVTLIRKRKPDMEEQITT